MRTNKQSQLAAMRYLADRLPEHFILYSQKYARYGSNLEWLLVEKVIKEGKEVLTDVHSISFERNFTDWD
jgi:hypothetical protein